MLNDIDQSFYLSLFASRVERRLRIIKKVLSRCKHDSETDCLVWQGPHSGEGRGGGYGRMSLDGATVAVHLAMWQAVHGPIPPRKQLDHTCNNRLCCNIDHLEMVTHKRNQARRAERQSSNSIHLFKSEGTKNAPNDLD